jgi:hypothetical protein
MAVVISLLGLNAGLIPPDMKKARQQVLTGRIAEGVYPVLEDMVIP